MIVNSKVESGLNLYKNNKKTFDDWNEILYYSGLNGIRPRIYIYEKNNVFLYSNFCVCFRVRQSNKNTIFFRRIQQLSHDLV